MVKVCGRGLAALLLTSCLWATAQAGIFGSSSSQGGSSRGFFRSSGQNSRDSSYGGYRNSGYPQGPNQPGYGSPYGDPSMQGFGQPGFGNPQQPVMQQPMMQPGQPPYAQPTAVPPIGDQSPEPPLAEPLPQTPPPPPQTPPRATIEAQLTSRPPSPREKELGEAVDNYLRRVHSAEPNVRSDSAMQLGRLRARRAIPPLLTLLKEDPSAQVRDAAARGLALIGSPEALDAVRQAALTDTDREVRYSASFAAEVIQSRQRRVQP